MWKQHILVCVVLALLAIPFYIADTLLLKGRGGGWISLNMTGLIIIPYVAFAAVHILLSTLALMQFPYSRLLSLHLFCGVLTIALLIASFVVYGQYQRVQDASNYQKRMDIVQQLRRVIELREWWYAPSAEDPREIHVRVKLNESGRFSGNAEGRAAGDYGEMVFNTENTPHRQATKGEEFTFAFPLHFLKAGKAQSVSITLYLFKDQSGTAPENVTMIFQDKPATDYDGNFIYAQLPPPTPR
jgi:hypothetical protein